MTEVAAAPPRVCSSWTNVSFFVGGGGSLVLGALGLGAGLGAGSPALRNRFAGCLGLALRLGGCLRLVGVGIETPGAGVAGGVDSSLMRRLRRRSGGTRPRPGWDRRDCDRSPPLAPPRS